MLYLFMLLLLLLLHQVSLGKEIYLKGPPGKIQVKLS